MKRLRMLISWLLLVGAFVVFLAAHGLPSFGNDRGWWVWEGILVFLRSSDPLNDPLVSVGTASFLTFTVLILVAPFIHWVWRRFSRCSGWIIRRGPSTALAGGVS
jgi:hypothetical protein